MAAFLPFRSIWAKTGKGDQSHLWGPLCVHMADSAETARLLWRRWLPKATRQYLANISGFTCEELEKLICWLTSVHDIGKATPAFQSKVPERADNVRTVGLTVPDRVQGGRNHAAMGQVILNEWLENRGWDYDTALTYTSIVGGHHGATPNESELEEISSSNRRRPEEWLGDGEWRRVHSELVSVAWGECGLDEIAIKLESHALSPMAQVLLTGLVIVADWISSNTELFPLTCETALTWSACTARANAGWDYLEFPDFLHLEGCVRDNDELFRSRFCGLPSDARLHPAQQVAIQAARELQDPGLLIVEAPMGNGKTEASLLCAEVFAEKFGSGGVAYLLPTMATSNAMFTRVHQWLETLCAATGTSMQSLQLMHSKAELNESFVQLKTWHPSWMGDDASNGESVIAHQWFSGRKRGLLASFVVGTVDQLLMAALNARHVHLRHLGLAGKVVVIDEVHAYDAYMNVYLDRALQFLGEYKVPTVLLSATLPPDRREALIRAYRGQRARVLVPEAPRTMEGRPLYPLITTASTKKDDTPQYRACEQSSHGIDVEISFLPDDEEALVAELKTLLAKGGCACVVRSTVVRAQETFRAISRALDLEVRLVHSRYIATDRAKNDRDLLNLLGPKPEKRPEALVVVGTQVIEQSLDIDFDLMVTDIAPVDLLLQRMGRLHRHNRGEGQSQRPPLLRKARCIITGTKDWNDAFPVFERGITHIYGNAVLWQTVLALRANAKGEVIGIRIPADIAPLVEQVYGGLAAMGELEMLPQNECLVEARKEWDEQVRSKEQKAKDWLLPKIGIRRALNGWMRDRLNLEDETRGRAAVRDSQESLEVIIAQESEGRLQLLPRIAKEFGVSGELGGDGSEPDPDNARVAALCSVSLPAALTMSWCIEDVIQNLEKQVPMGWEKSHWLRGTLPLVMDEYGHASIPCGGQVFQIGYSSERGLEILDREGGADEP